jgi:hypothetical protein
VARFCPSLGTNMLIDYQPTIQVTDIIVELRPSQPKRLCGGGVQGLRNKCVHSVPALPVPLPVFQHVLSHDTDTQVPDAVVVGTCRRLDSCITQDLKPTSISEGAFQLCLWCHLSTVHPTTHSAHRTLRFPCSLALSSLLHVGRRAFFPMYRGAFSP